MTADTSQQVWLIRHGETEWSRSGQHTGRTDVPLTGPGEAAARAVGPALAGQRFAAVWTSPLRRARRTCELAGFGAAAEPCDDLMEWDYGGYEGRTSADIRRERPSWVIWRDGVRPGRTAGESIADVGGRADRVLQTVRAVDGDVALFAHGHLLRVLTARWLGLPPTDGRLFALSTAALSVLGYDREIAAILRWNDTHHLDHAAG